AGAAGEVAQRVRLGLEQQVGAAAVRGQVVQGHDRVVDWVDREQQIAERHVAALAGGAELAAREHLPAQAAMDVGHPDVDEAVVAGRAHRRNLRTTLSVIRETLLSYESCARLPPQVHEPTEKTAPPFGYSRYVMS